MIQPLMEFFECLSHDQAYVNALAQDQNMLTTGNYGHPGVYRLFMVRKKHPWTL